MGWLFNKIGDFFTVDDGSFPEICICHLDQEEIADGYLLMRNSASFVVGAPMFQNLLENREMPLSECENPAKLVCEGNARPFHFMLRQLKLENCVIPELGIFILDNAIALDFQKGRYWGEKEIEGLFLLLYWLRKNSTKSIIRLEDILNPADKENFFAAYDEFTFKLQQPD